MFDFGWYQVRHDRGSSVEEWHWFSCALAQPDGSWPPLLIAHQGLVEKAMELAKGDPIRFESEEFNRTFHVECDDRRFASALIDPQMMQFLLETKGMVSFATLGRFLLLTSPQVAPDEMPILLGLANEFVRRIPPAAWELYPKAAPAGPDALASSWRSPAGPGLAADPRPARRRLGPDPGCGLRPRRPSRPRRDRGSVARPPAATPRPAAAGSHRVSTAP